MSTEAMREAFEKHFHMVEFDQDQDAWGRWKYKHPHVQSLWDGWQARAALASDAEPVGRMREGGKIIDDDGYLVGIPVGSAIYLAPPSTAQSVEAALRKAAEVAKKHALDELAAHEAEQEILALIPTEAAQPEPISALELPGMWEQSDLAGGATDAQVERDAKDAELFRSIVNLADWYVGPEYATYNDEIIKGEYYNYTAGSIDELRAAIASAKREGKA